MQEEEKENDDLFEISEIKVDGKQSPLRIDKFLQIRTQFSRNRIQDAIKAGSITVDDKQIKANHKVKPGELIKMVLPRYYGAESPLLAEDIALDIRFEDEDLLILHKPPGLVVHPGVGNWTGTLANALAFHFGKELPVLEGNGHNRIGLVHRIDKDTSGLMVVAKSDLAMTHLAKQFFDHTIERTYYALVWGDLEQDKGTISNYVGRDDRNPRVNRVYEEGEDGKLAITHYEVIERMYYTTLVKCNLETGRTHQIRVHMQHLGHPLFSDRHYGGDKIVKGTVYSKYKQYVEKIFTAMPRQALHAKSIGFEHPRTGERMLFDSELPEDFQTGMNLWRDYVAQRKAGKKNMP
ncbi:RluA family pseudouridine synthase [Lewinella cohaerens]|uniref:RluA family pseudouridine synthase n=1 Tax=Lewinella cohaerens TaxID=70995 RepID=UPI000382C8E9|nr:RluA family pseudouridine synthase [Lewinella cohaerens]